MTAPRYKLCCWGARGTAPTPAADKLRFGGNTSCLAVEIGEREHVILDCGSGIRLLGNHLTKRSGGGPSRFHIFFTHYHFDHIEGLPLFQPLYDADSVITFYGAEAAGRSVRSILESYVSPPYFPVPLASMPAKLDYASADGAPTRIGDLTVSALALNHPDGCLSFRLEHGERRIVYATDHEHGDERTDRALVEFSRRADYLIYDATYQPAEYEELRRGWGHSTWYAAVQTALAAEVGTLVLFHHHPDHTDDELASVLEIARREFPSIQVSSEGMKLPF